MVNLKIKIVTDKGLGLLSTEIYWGEELESIKLKLSANFKMYHHSMPDISSVGNRFTKGKLFANYNCTEINNGCADGYNFQLGFDDQNKLIEFCSVWNFDLEVEFLNISYCKSFADQVTELKLNQIELVDIDDGSVIIKKYNIIMAKSCYQDPYWNKGDLIEYLYIAEHFKSR